MKHEDITAWVLDELTPAEREQVEALLEQDPQIRQSASETKKFCKLLHEELRDDSLAFTAEQRQQLLAANQRHSALAPESAPKPVKWRTATAWTPWAAVAACGVIGGYFVYDHFLQSQRANRVTQTAPASPSEFRVSMAEPAPQMTQAEMKKLGALPGSLPGALPGVIPTMPEVAFAPLNDQTARDGGITNIKTLDELNAKAGVTYHTSPQWANTGIAEFNEPRIVLADPNAPSGYFDQSSPVAEAYSRLQENTLKDVVKEPLSTFSIDVDTASYANVRRFLNENRLPPADAVRIEELVNYFPSQEQVQTADAQEPFAARVEMAACPWQPQHRLARVVIQGKEVQKSSKASNLVFLVDVSGSMESAQKLPLVKQSLRMLAEQMGEKDRISLVTYANGSEVVLKPTHGEDRRRILDAVDALKAGGSTNGSGGLRLAYAQAAAGHIREGINRVILCTDGDFNVGISEPAELGRFITEQARSGTFLSVLGFGSGNLKDATMETLADQGNGNYAYIDSSAEARKVLVEQMSGTLITIAKDVKVQVEFNPAQVRSYRLIGYENRLLAKEDFNDDTKDAGEIGSGHRVVALYEIVPAHLPAGAEPDRIVDTLKYQTLATPTPTELKEVKPKPTGAVSPAASHETMTVKLRYKLPEGEKSSKIEIPVTDTGATLEAASEEFLFSSAVAGFGLLLRDSSYKGTLTWADVRELALAGKGADKLGYRGEFLQLIDKAAGLSGQENKEGRSFWKRIFKKERSMR